ncbi:MAG: hypothetical protein ACYTCN_02430 [Planctomycetota bacterium]|jgi:hypothetical protein
MKQVIFAVYSLHRHLIQEVGWFVIEHEAMVREAARELAEMRAFVERQQELTKDALELTVSRIKETVEEE